MGLLGGGQRLHLHNLWHRCIWWNSIPGQHICGVIVLNDIPRTSWLEMLWFLSSLTAWQAWITAPKENPKSLSEPRVIYHASGWRTGCQLFVSSVAWAQLPQLSKDESRNKGKLALLVVGLALQTREDMQVRSIKEVVAPEWDSRQIKVLWATRWNISQWFLISVRAQGSPLEV